MRTAQQWREVIQEEDHGFLVEALLRDMEELEQRLASFADLEKANMLLMAKVVELTEQVERLEGERINDYLLRG